MTRRLLRFAVAVLAFAPAGGAALRADWVVQVAAFAEAAHVTEGSARLKKAGFPVVTEEFTPKVGRPLTRLLVGPYLDRKAAQAIASRLQALGWPGYVRRFAPAPPPTVIAAAPSQPPVSPPAPARQPAPKPAEPRKESPRAPPPAPVQPAPAKPVETAAEPVAPPAAADEDVPVPPPPAAPAISLPSADTRGVQKPFKLFGYYQLEGAYTVPPPAHASKFKNLLEIGASGKLAEGLQWKVSGRFWYDAIYDVTSFYPQRVKDDARFFYGFRETYIDASVGDFDIRAGRQHILWGEVVGLFFADVVSARELHEFLARDLEFIRIPQWALRVEWTKENFHAEAIGIPYMTYDRIGAPGSDFYPSPPPPPPGSSQIILDERTPPHTLRNGAYGARLSYLAGGFDTAAFYYDSVDASPAFTRQILAGPVPTFFYRPDHARIRQAGLTLAKDLGAVVIKTEAIYTSDRRLPVTRLTDADGLVPQNMVDAIVAVEYPFAEGARVNLQLFTRGILSRDPDLYNAPAFDPGIRSMSRPRRSTTVSRRRFWASGASRSRGGWPASRRCGASGKTCASESGPTRSAAPKPGSSVDTRDRSATSERSATRFRNPGSAPVTLDPVVAVDPVARPMAWHPVGTVRGRQLPAPRNPDVGVAVPAVEAPDPDMPGRRRRDLDLDNRDWRRHPNVHARAREGRRGRQETAEDRGRRQEPVT